MMGIETGSAVADVFFFEDRCAGELQRHATHEAAMAVAEETLAVYRREAGRDGEWSLDVEDVVVGRVVPGAGEDGEDDMVTTHRATASGDETGGYDYAMRLIAPIPA